MLPITAIVVTYNEAKRLPECLQSLDFCDELIVVDLGSTDATLDIAKSFTSQTIIIPRVDYGELALIQVLETARNDWVISQDPDEVFPEKLIQQLREVISDESVAKIITPLKFYFLGKPLEGSVWGGEKYKDRVFNKHKVTITPLIHQGIKVKPGFRSATISFEVDNHIKHYWTDTIGNLFEKHWRYIKNEGKTRYITGKRFSIKTLLRSTYYALVDNLFRYHALKDGVRGIFLSLFYAWYIMMSNLSLFYYQTFVEKNPRSDDAIIR